MKQLKPNLHPSFVKSQLYINEQKYLLLEKQYNDGSPAMKNYVKDKLEKARKSYLKWLDYSNKKDQTL